MPLEVKVHTLSHMMAVISDIIPLVGIAICAQITYSSSWQISINGAAPESSSYGAYDIPRDVIKDAGEIEIVFTPTTLKVSGFSMT